MISNRQRAMCNTKLVRNNEPRVPLALQKVFIRGNCGLDVHTPQPDHPKSCQPKSWWRLSRSNHSKNSDENKEGKEKKQPSRPKTKEVKRKLPTLSPQQYLDGLIQSRGYSIVQYPALSCAYYNKPSPLQVASYGIHVVNIVNKGNYDALQELLKLGLSPNACNAHGESILNHVCRCVDDVRMLHILLDYGCIIQTCDQNGRTPLHHACWAVTTKFDFVEKILEQDVGMLYMADSHGHLPLSFIQQEHWSDWLQFFQARKEMYWPRITTAASKDHKAALPQLTQLKPNTRRIRDPDPALSIELAKMVASGKLHIKEVKFLMTTLDHDIEDVPYMYDDYDDDSKFDDDESSTYGDDDSDSDDDDDDDDDEDGEESIHGDSLHIKNTIEGTDNDAAQVSKSCHDTEDVSTSNSGEVEVDSEDDVVDNSDTESWREMKKTLQGLAAPMLRPIQW